jgi:hypothetical protein
VKFDVCWQGCSPHWLERRRVRAGWVASLASTIRNRAATLQRGVTFDDVAGIGEATDEPPEIIDAFLRVPTATYPRWDKCPRRALTPAACDRQRSLGFRRRRVRHSPRSFRSSVARRAPLAGTIDDLAVVSLLGQSGVRRGAPPAWNCTPDAPPMPRHRRDKRGHRLRTFGREISRPQGWIDTASRTGADVALGLSRA